MAVTTRTYMGDQNRGLALRSSSRLSFYSMTDMTQTGGGKTVLVVDDHDLTRQTIARMLEAGGFAVVQASSGREALDRLATDRDNIDIVLSDVTMPGMTGIDLSYQIRELYPAMPVAIVSGDVSELERSIIGRAEVPFIKKPFHAESLYSAVKEAIRRQAN
jgi:two-component system, cell cycle sensor histidine kinase and response regulator CckA